MKNTYISFTPEDISKMSINQLNTLKNNLLDAQRLVRTTLASKIIGSNNIKTL